jgi:hypothetical protein
VDGFRGYVFGGQFADTDPAYSLNLMYQVDLRDGTWTRLATNNASLPSPFGSRGVPYFQDSAQTSGRTGCALWNIDQMLYFFGGTSNYKVLFNDMWSFNLSSSKWTWINGNYSGYGPMTQSSVTYLGIRNASLNQMCLGARFRLIHWTQKKSSSLFFVGGFGV